jgi:hypothetical protein
MALDDSNWTYNEFLAFLLVYSAEMNYPLTVEELQFIQTRTEISDILKIKQKVDSVSDAEAMDIIDDYKKRYLDTPEKSARAKQHLEDLLKTPVSHSPLETAVVHIIERFIR